MNENNQPPVPPVTPPEQTPLPANHSEMPQQPLTPQQHPYALPNVEKKSKTTMIVLIVVGVIVFLGLAGTGAWLVIRGMSDKDKEQSSSQNTAQTKDTDSIDDSTSSAPSAPSSSSMTPMTAVSNIRSNATISASAITSGTSSPVYKTPGYNFYNSSVDGASITVNDPSSSASGTRLQFMSAISKAGFTIVTNKSGLPSDDSLDYYQNGDVLCSIERAGSPSPSTNLRCGTYESFKAAAVTLQSIVSSYPNSTSDIKFGNPSIKNSPVSGYQRAEVSADGGAQLFYRKNGGSWNYFRGTQSTIPCSAFNTTDLKNAFNGESCISTSGGTATVR